MIILIKSIFDVFLYVVAGSTFVSASYLIIFIPDAQLSVSFLWQIIIASFLCALGNIILWSPKELSALRLKIRYVIHYLYNLVVIYSWLFLMKWINLGNGWTSIVFIFFGFTFVYGIIVCIMVQRDRQFASLANDALRKYHQEDSSDPHIN